MHMYMYMHFSDWLLEVACIHTHMHMYMHMLTNHSTKLINLRTYAHTSMHAYEALIAADTQRGRFSFGDSPGLADVYLIPQIESARRFKVDLSRWPLITGIEQACNALAGQQLAAGRMPLARLFVAAGCRNHAPGNQFLA